MPVQLVNPNDTLDQMQLLTPSMQRPGGMEINPFKSGLQLGVLGAAAGIGLAGIHRAIRLQAGNNAPVSAVKPMVIGAIIGGALGSISGYRSLRQMEDEQIATAPTTWPAVAEQIQNNMGKYAGLKRIVKMGQDAEGAVQEPVNTKAELARAGLYLVPVVGTGMSVWDALKGYGSGVKNLATGNVRKGVGGLGIGLGNTLLALATLIPGGAMLTKGTKLLRTARRLDKIPQLARVGTPAATRMATEAATLGSGKLGPLFTRMAPMMQGIRPSTLSKVERFGKGMKAMAPKFVHGIGGGFVAPVGLTMGGMMLEGMPSPGQLSQEPAMRPVYQAAVNRAMPYVTNIRQRIPKLYPPPQFEVPAYGT